MRGVLLLSVWMGWVGLSCSAEVPEEAPAPGPVVEALEGPWVVAIQPGHWLVEELPDELVRLRQSTGTAWGRVREVEVNLAVARALVPMVEARGWTAVLIPATVPPGLRADAFVSIHADGSADTRRQGWKLAPPWRPSPAALDLSRALEGAFGAETDLVHDASGITVNMRGYFGFSHRRFTHAASPYTPSVLVELGFLSHAQDRRRLVEDPERYARVLVKGLETYFAARTRDRVDDLVPPVYPRLEVAPGGAQVVARPEGAVVTEVAEGTPINPVGEADGWYEVSLRAPRVMGWIAKDDLVPWGYQRPRWD